MSKFTHFIILRFLVYPTRGYKLYSAVQKSKTRATGRCLKTRPLPRHIGMHLSQ